MTWLDRWRLRRSLETDLNEEIRQHLDEKAAEFIAAGLSPADAASRAMREFGNVPLLQERSRDVWRSAGVIDFWKDVRYALRFLGRSKGFAAAAIVTLAIGIGANTAVFSVVNAVLLRPLPYPDSDRLVSIRSRDVRGTPHPSLVSYPTFFDFRAENDVFEHIVSYRDTTFGLTGQGPASHLTGQIVSWDLFDTLRVQPALGRPFVADDERPGARVAIISDDLWRTHFGHNSAIVGASVLLDRQPFTIVGVAPARFNFPLGPRPVQVWTTLAVDTSAADGTPISQQRGARMLDVIARLKPGTSIAVAHAHLDALGTSLADKHPDQNKNVATTYVRPVRDQLVETARSPLLILLGAVGLVVVIACANIANLLLVRLVDRGREFAMRFAIGASRGRLLRQVFTEHLVLALIGSLAGVWLPIVAVQAARPVWADILPRMDELTVDWRVVAFSIALSVTTAVLVGLPTVVQLARANLSGFLKDGAWGSTHGRERMHGALVVMQIACGLVLLSAAGLLIGEFAHLMRRDLGFEPHQVLTFEIDLPGVDYSGDKQVLFVTRLLERLRALPGVTSAAAGSPLPITGHQMSVSFQIQERPSAPAERPSADMAIVTPGYFQTIGAPIEQGRDFSDRDNDSTPPVLIVNRAFADRFFPGEDPIGKLIEPGATMKGHGTRTHEIVGVVRSARQAPLGLEDDPIYYFAYRQLTWFPPALVVRSAVPPESLVPAVRAAVGELDNQVPVDQIRTLDALLSAGVAQPRFVMMFVAAFATMALLLTAIGLYGVLAYAVTSRAREIGVRMALGASRASITLAVLKRASTLVGVGLAIGGAGAIAGNHILRSVLEGLSVNTAQLLAGACLTIVVTATLAALLPALRAASLDPLRTLRSE